MKEQELIGRVQTGDLAAFEELIKLHASAVLRVALRILGQREDAQDVTQEAFLRAWKHRDGFRPETDTLRHWLCLVATNLAYDRLRVRGRIIVSQAIVEMARQDETDPTDGLLCHELVSALPETFRSVVILRFWHGHSVAETARLLDLPVGTVLSRVYRAREYLERLTA